jgi:hypothetical protein
MASDDHVAGDCQTKIGLGQEVLERHFFSGRRKAGSRAGPTNTGIVL